MDFEKWKNTVSGISDAVSVEAVHKLTEYVSQLRLSGAIHESPSAGVKPAQSLLEALGDDVLYRQVALLSGDVVLLRSVQCGDVDFLLVRLKENQTVETLCKLTWSLDLFLPHAGCALPGPAEMSFPVGVSCTGQYAVISGPATRLREPGNSNSYFPESQLVTVNPPAVEKICFKANHWPTRILFHPREEHYLLALVCSEPTYQCPTDRFCHSPNTLVMYNVQQKIILQELSDVALAPSLLSFTHNAEYVLVLSAMKVKDYSVASAQSGNSTDVTWIQCHCSLPSLTITHCTSAPDILSWLHTETADHVSKTTHLTAVTSTSGHTAHVLAYTSLSGGNFTVFTVQAK